MSGTKIVTKCPSCGELELPATAVQMLPNRDVYVFTCPSCKKQVEKSMNSRIREILKSAGVRELEVVSPSNERQRGMPALSRDDLIDFMLKLNEMPVAPEHDYDIS